MRAKIEWKIGKIPLLGESSRVWWGVDKVLDKIERLMIRFEEVVQNEQFF